MKEIEIIINGDKLERVKRILSAFSKNGIFVSQGFGYGHQQGYHQVYTRDDNRGVNMLPKVSVRTVVADDLVDPIVNEMVSSMGNATFGDGKIFIKDVAEAIRVRTGETGMRRCSGRPDGLGPDSAKRLCSPGIRRTEPLCVGEGL